MALKKKVLFEDFSNQDQKKLVQNLHKQVQILVPEWCDKLIYRKSVGSGDSTASAWSEKKYRFSVIYINDCFFSMPEEDLLPTIIHELVHLHHHPVQQFIKSTCESLYDKETEKKHLDLNSSLFVELNEFFVETFAQIIHDLIASK